MIDYEAAKAREKTVQNLRGETQSFINKDNEISATGVKVRELKNNLEEQESTLRGIEDQLANPDDNMLPLGIFKNRAYIHLVHTQILE